MFFRFKQENCLSVSGYVCVYVCFILFTINPKKRFFFFFQSSNQA